MSILFILLWSSGSIISELGLKENAPLVFATLRLSFASIAMLAFFLYFRPALPSSWKQFGFVAVTGILLQGLYQFFFVMTLSHHVSPGLTSIILGIQPLLTLCLLNECLTMKRTFSLCVGLFGLALVVSNTLFSGIITVSGISFALLSLSAITLGTLMQKKYCTEVPAITNLFIQYSISTLMLIMMLGMTKTFSVSWSLPFVFSVFWTAFVVSGGASLVYIYLLTKKNASDVTSLLYCVPPVTIIFDYIIYHHRLTLISLVGMFCIMTSMLLFHAKNN